MRDGRTVSRRDHVNTERVSDDRKDHLGGIARYAGMIRDTSAKCAAPPCATRVAYAGDFCGDCRRIQRQMREMLRARKG